MQIAILGGGIAGLCASIALKQAGYEVEVYERHAKTSNIGAGIVCWPNASFILDKLGVLVKLKKVSSSLNKMNRFSCDGEAIGSLDINMLSELMGYQSYSVLRKDLMKILTERVLELKIQVHYQHNVISLAEREVNKAMVKFDNGKSIHPDIIIGADGRMNSIARHYVYGNNSPKYHKLINWIGVFESNNDLFNDMSVSDYWGIGQRFGIVPVSKNKAYWAGASVSESISENINENNNEKIRAKDPSMYKAELKAMFSHWPAPISTIIDQTPVSSINKIYIHDHDPINKWHKNNVILLGDAAHAALPTSGQGACQAMEDGWHFSNVLTESSGHLLLAFSRFTALRLAKTEDITMAGRQLSSSIFNRDPEFCKQRNLISKSTDYHALVNGMAKGWASKLPLKRAPITAV